MRESKEKGPPVDPDERKQRKGTSILNALGNIFALRVDISVPSLLAP
jgi:hypothetical protein